MKNQIKPMLAAGFVLAGLGVAGFAMADSGKNGDEAAERRAFLASKVSVADAAVAAEAETGARAMSVEFGEEDGAFMYEIELLTKDGAELEAHVDANTAAVTAVKNEDRDDGDDDSDNHHEDEKD